MIRIATFSPLFAALMAGAAAAQDDIPALARSADLVAEIAYLRAERQEIVLNGMTADQLARIYSAEAICMGVSPVTFTDEVATIRDVVLAVTGIELAPDLTRIAPTLQSATGCGLAQDDNLRLREDLVSMAMIIRIDDAIEARRAVMSRRVMGENEASQRALAVMLAIVNRGVSQGVTVGSVAD